MQKNLTEGPITKNLLYFALPMMAGNLLQQFYNIADTWVVGQYLGADALAAVGSSYTLMVFLTSILLGLCMGSGAAFSIQFGRRDMERMKNSMFLSVCLYCGRHGRAERRRLFRARSDRRRAPGSHRGRAAHERLSANHFSWHQRDVPL